MSVQRITHQHVRRIPRGKSGRVDSIARLQRQALANSKRIKGMMRRVPRNDSERYEALAEARRRLVAVLVTISTKPEEVATGTLAAIDGAMASARQAYSDAYKTKRKARRQGRGDDDRREKTEGPEIRHEAMKATDSSPSPRAVHPRNREHDQKADDFQAKLDTTRDEVMAAQ